MDAFIVAFVVAFAFVFGCAAGSIWTLGAVKSGRFADEGYSYSYFSNVRKRRMMGRA